MTNAGAPQVGTLNPYVRQEAETIAWEQGIETEPASGGGMNVGFIDNGDYIKVKGVAFGTGATSYTARVASAGSGGTIELRLDGTSGPLVGSCPVSGTGGWQTWTDTTCGVSGATGTHDLYLRFTGGSGSLFNIDYWRFTERRHRRRRKPAHQRQRWRVARQAGCRTAPAGRCPPNTTVAARRQPAHCSITGRTAASWNGPSQDVTSKLTNGKSYTTSVWVRSQSGTPTAKATLRCTANGTTNYVQLTPAEMVIANGRTQLTGTATASWTGTLASATFYVETAAGTDSLFIDDASFQ